MLGVVCSTMDEIEEIKDALAELDEVLPVIDNNQTTYDENNNAIVQAQDVNEGDDDDQQQKVSFSQHHVCDAQRGVNCLFETCVTTGRFIVFAGYSRYYLCHFRLPKFLKINVAHSHLSVFLIQNAYVDHLNTTHTKYIHYLLLTFVALFIVSLAKHLYNNNSTP